jgi:hypothetical protein
MPAAIHLLFLSFEMCFPLYAGGYCFVALILHSYDFCTFRKLRIFLLAMFWVCGLEFGDFVFRFTGSNLVSQMPLAAMRQPSIFGLLTSAFIPFLFSAFAVYISAPGLLFVIAFVKAMLFGLVSAAVCAAFGSAGWLVRVLLLFTDLCSVVFLYGYWLRHITGFRHFSAGSFAGYLLLVTGIVLADFYYISPLLQRCLL